MESFNHALLTYLPKRIHFGDMTYDMRMHFAVMDWVSICTDSYVVYTAYSITTCNIYSKIHYFVISNYRMRMWKER